MTNMTLVIGKKDILKYTFKTAILIFFLFIFNNILNINSKQINILNIFNIIDKNKLIICIEDNLKLSKLISEKEENTNKEKINPLKIILDTQLSAISSINESKNTENFIQPEEKQEIDQIEKIEHAKTGISTQVIQNNVPTKFTNTYNGVQVRNETGYQLTEEMLKPDIQVNNENILIFHTHTCESYTPSENYIYQQSGTYRTTDLNYNVARVGTELEKQLNSYGYKVLHDKTYHDYPAYNGSYGRSLTTVKSLLEHNKNTDVVIDIHRDAIGDYSYAPTVQIGEEQAAQLMFVIGTDGGGLEHNNWNENLKFAIKVQEKANELYPGLFKPIILRNSRYNQHLAKGASIIEVGATGNTLPQCLNSMKYLAKVINEVMK